ncbi:MAG: tetratricopeptide repeat protein, partial [Parvularculaceae bacterium]
MLGLGLDDLVRREERRRTIRRRVMTTALTAFSVWMTGNTWYAITQRNEAQAQRQIAEAQTENVNAALNYLVAQFEIANPATENPKTITALTILERGRKKIDAELGDKPAVRARLLNAIGMAYQNLGDVKEAGPILADAAKGPFFSLGDEVRAKMDYADAMTNLREFDRSKKLIEETSAKIDSQAGEIPADDLNLFRMQVVQQRAKASYRQTKHDIAIEQYLQAITLCEKSVLCTPIQRASLSNNLSIAFSEIGQLDEARKELLVVKEIYLKEFGSDHLRTATTNQNIAYRDFLAGDYQSALALMLSVVTFYEKLLDENHPTRATANLLLGRLYYAVRDDAKAVDALNASLNAFQLAYGAKHNEVAVVSIYRSLALARNGQAEAALADLRRAEAIYRQEYSGDDPNFGDLEAHKGFVLAMSGLAAEAAAACERGVAQMARSLQPDDSWLAEIKTQCDPILGKIAANGN